MPLQKLYNNKSVLVTGGLGFIGANLSIALHRLGAHVSIMAPRWPADDSHLSPTLKDLKFILGDLRDSRAMEKAVEGMAIIFNLAGRSGVASERDAALESLDVNCRGHMTLLEACRKRNPSVRIVFPSSRLVYAPALAGWVSETAPTEPISFYGIHKLAVEKYHQLYSRLCGLSYVILRVTNPYGAHQKASQVSHGIVNYFIHQARQGKKLTIFGAGNQLRDYIYIDDLLSAMLLAGCRPAAVNQVLNVGSGLGVPLVDMARLATAMVGGGDIDFLPWPESAEKAETGDFVADIQKARLCLGWEPRFNLQQGMREVFHGQ